jgi:hypothetical protein
VKTIRLPGKPIPWNPWRYNLIKKRGCNGREKIVTTTIEMTIVVVVCLEQKAAGILTQVPEKLSYFYIKCAGVICFKKNKSLTENKRY